MQRYFRFGISSLLRSVLATALAAATLALLPAAPTHAVMPGAPTAAPDTGPVGASETQVSDQAAPGGVDRTAVAYHPGAGRFLELWVGTRLVGSPAGPKQEVLGRYVDALTGATDGAIFTVASVGGAGDPSQDAVDPSLAWDTAASRFVVTYAGDITPDAPTAEDTTDFRIFVRTLDPATGTLSAPVAVTDTVAAGDDARRPDIAATGGQRRLAWEVVAAGDADADVRTVRLSGVTQTGTIHSATAVISHLSGRWSKPAVAVRADGEAVVVFEGKIDSFSGAAARVYGMQLGTDDVDHSIQYLGEGINNAAYIETDPDVTLTPGANYRVVWSSNTLATPADFEVRGNEISPCSGLCQVLANQDLVDGAGENLTPSVSTNVDGEVVVAWVNRQGTDHQVWGGRFARTTGALIDSARVSTLRGASDAPPTRPSVAWSNKSRGTSLIAWSGESTPTLAAGESEAWARLLSGPNSLVADLRTGLAVSPAAPGAPVTGVETGDTITWQVTYANASGDPVDSATVTLSDDVGGDIVDASISYGTPAGNTVTQEGSSPLTWTVTGLDPGEFGTILVSGKLVADRPSGTSVSRTASISALGNVDPLPSNDSSTLSITSNNKPWVTAVTRVGSGPVNSSVAFDVTFSEPVTGYDNADAELITLGNASASIVTPSSPDATTRRITFSGLSGDGSVALRVSPTVTAVDASSKPLSTGNLPITSTFATVDTTRPTATLDAPPGSVSGPFEVSIAFSEPVSGITLDDVVVGNGVASDLSGGGDLYTVTITPAGDGPVTVDVPLGAGIDQAGNGSAAATQLVRTSDATRPGVTLSAPAGPFNAPFRSSVEFTEVVSGLTAGDFTATGATISDLQGSGSSYSVLVTPTVQGPVQVDLPQDAAVDSVGNGSAAAEPLLRSHDSVTPTVELTAPAGPLNAPFHVTVSFSEPINGLALGDFDVTNATVNGLVGGGGTYNLLVTPASDGPVSLSLPAGRAADAAGNGNQVSNTLERQYDGSRPTLTLGAPAGPVNSAFSVSLGFSEPVTGVTLADVAVTGGSASALTGSGSAYAVTVTPSGEGPVVVSVANGAAVDAAGNTSTGDSLTRTADLTRPTLTLGAPAGPVNSAFSVSLGFSEPVTGVTLADVAVTGGSASALTGSGSAYAVTVTPSGDGPVVVSVADGAAVDAAGNTSTGDSLTRTADLSGPTVTLAAPAGPVNAPFAVTLTFSKPVTGLTASDLAVTNGTASGLSGTGPYTVTITPVADGPVTVSLPADAVTDSAGNGNAASATLTRVHDATAPVLTITRAPGQPDPVVANQVSFVVESNEPVSDLTSGEVTVGGTSGATTATVTRVDTDTFSVAVTGMTATGSVTVTAAAGAVADAAGNTSAAATSPSVAWAASGAPVISPVFDQTCAGAVGNIALRLAPDAGSTLAVSSNNTVLLPRARITLTRTGSALALSVQPVAGRSGVAQVTVTATNASGSSSYVVRVVVGTVRVDELVGGALTDIMFGRGANDQLSGNDGMDLLCGGPGNDRLTGGQGRDSLYGQGGNDTLIGSPDVDKLVGGPGTDTNTPGFAARAGQAVLPLD